MLVGNVLIKANVCKFLSVKSENQIKYVVSLLRRLTVSLLSACLDMMRHDILSTLCSLAQEDFLRTTSRVASNISKDASNISKGRFHRLGLS